MPLIFDTHTHYYDEDYDLDRHELLTSLKDKNAGLVMGASSDMNSSRLTVGLTEKYDFVYGSVGIHPHHAKDFADENIAELTALAQLPKIKAIGEIGFDYHYNHSTPDEQRVCFIRLLELAKELDMPVVIHNREAHADTMELLRKYRPKGVVHCYSGSVEMADELIKMGMYIGLGGPVTFKNAKTPKEVAAHIPLDRLLLETDCPYLAPTPYRGQRNDSGFLSFVADEIAGLRNISAEEVITQAAKNGMELFNI